MSERSKRFRQWKSLDEAVRDTQRLLFGERYVGASLSDSCAPSWAQVLISKFMDNPKNFLVYCGNPGIGKTQLSASLVEFGLTRFSSFRKWSEYDLLTRVRSSIDEFKGSDYIDTLKYLIDDEFVILDDIGSTGVTDWRKEVIFAAIDMRYNSMKPTLITSNLSKDEFKTLFHDRLH